jgi:hypothetical protein
MPLAGVTARCALCCTSRVLTVSRHAWSPATYEAALHSRGGMPFLNNANNLSKGAECQYDSSTTNFAQAHCGGTMHAMAAQVRLRLGQAGTGQVRP